ncbi:alpha/beta fold hydrolase [Mycobacterium spongiae]|uniref:Alpha/beta fold hydrolase n=1 Tax=Mycobacterium spongiae TaxID=886343 RepID=A0A975PYE4_9MYCO|nr:alpha/beta hydrolase [Mycobacterium spongiae]QUR68713.1 alpha/beta fold hydrolase [Mycobacterium spongiae]
MPIAPINGQQIHYTDSGGDGAAVIATHAFLMDIVTLEPLTARLVEAGYRVVAFDFRGHGQTVYDKSPHTYLDVAADALGLADHLGIGSFTFLAEGIGGIVAMRTAMCAPERVSRLVLLGPSADAAPEGENAALDEGMAVWCSVGPDPVLYGHFAKYGTANAEDADALMERWRNSAWSDFWPAADTVAARPRFVDELSSIRCPALVVHHKRDFLLPVMAGREVADSLGGPTTFVPMGTGAHSITMAFDPQVGDIVLEWLATEH